MCPELTMLVFIRTHILDSSSTCKLTRIFEAKFHKERRPFATAYGSKADPDDHLKLSMPNPCDNEELANFKARVRARHETFNGRIKFFRSC
jgi:hypothetical protein